MATTISHNGNHLEQLQQLLDDLAIASMSANGQPEAGNTLIEQLNKLSLVANDAGFSDLSLLANGLADIYMNPALATDVAALRDGVTKMQETLAHSSGTPSEGSDPTSESIIDPELVGDFIVESREHLQAAEEYALALEKDAKNSEIINALFRGFHSIKGLAAFLELHRIYAFAHKVETLLDYARNDELDVDSEIIDIILKAVDFLNRSLSALETGNIESVPPIEVPVAETIERVIQERAHPKDQAAKAVPEPEEETPAAEPEDASFMGEPDATPLPEEGESVAVAVESEPAAPPEPAETQAEVVESEPAPLPETAKVQRLTPEISEEVASEAKAASSTASAGDKPTSGAGSDAEKKYSVRVDTQKLDYLMDMVGEMVIAQSRITTELSLQNQADCTLLRTMNQLTQVTREVQRVSLGMRMVGIGQLFRRTARIIRDLSRKFGKQVEVELIGEETELDKSIAEELADPLMHMVRNSVDHGIESREARIASGKNPVATVRLHAYHLGSQVVIKVSDDGRGLDRDKILAKARSNGLVGDEQLEDAQIVDLIFTPGFSTADQITTVSGRGVGMDVVRQHVERLRGRIEVETKPGEGTQFTIKLPLTRAIIDGLVVSVGGLRYVIPVTGVRETLRPAESSVKPVNGKGELAIVHGHLLPILRLHREFSIDGATQDPWTAVLVVAETDGKQFCILVDELIGKQEVVVKSLGQALKDVPGVSGGTILGDGRVGLILDLPYLGARAC